MAWLRSAMNKAAEVRDRSSFSDVVRSHIGYIGLPGNDAVSSDAKKLRDQANAQSIKSYKEAIRTLEEDSVSSKGEERVQLLKRWLVSLREIERHNAGSAENDEKNSKESHSPSDKNDFPGKLDIVLYYDPDLGESPVNFRDVLLQSQALEGITMSMVHSFV